jgi:hypothetical protein
VAASERVKASILNNKFTPNSNNRQTHFDVTFCGKQYRSSWECVYQSLNPHDEYEKLRIPYTLDGKTKIFIVDFVNHTLKTVTEVKPSSIIYRCKVSRIKLEALYNWAASNGYKATIFNEYDIVALSEDIKYDLFDTKTEQRIKALIKRHEANKKNKDIQA